MRPLSITVDGFRSYADRSEFDLRNHRLVGIVGPIGSGKSSILDAVAFALYGVTPSERASTKSLIHQRADAARVELVFEVDGQVWRAVRVLRRAGQSEHALFRYETDEAFLGGESPLETILKKGEVDQRVEEILGLDFAAFNRSVMLAQGRFAELLRATPTQRDEVLKGVFGFERVGRMERLAKLRRDTAAREVEQLGAERDALAETRSRLESAEVALARAVTRNAALEAVEPPLTARKEEESDLLRGIRAEEQRLAELADLGDRMPRPTETTEVVERASKSINLGLELEQQAADARSEAQEAAQGVERRLEGLGGGEGLARAVEVVSSLRVQRASIATLRDKAEQAAEEHRRAAERLTQAADDLQLSVISEQEATAALELAQSNVERAESAHHAAQHRDMAATLRTQLEAGGVCPVCAQSVQELPDTEAVDLSITQTLLEGARADAGRAAAEAKKTAQRHAVAEKDVEAAESGVRRATQATTAIEADLGAAGATLAGLTSTAVELLGEGDPEQLLETSQAILAAERIEAQKAAGRADELQRQADAARKEADEAGTALEDITAKLHGIAGRLGHDMSIGRTPDDVQAALEELRNRWVKAQTAAAESKTKMEAAMEECRQASAELLRSAELDPSADFAKERAASHAAVARLDAEVELHRERLEAASTIDVKVTEAEGRLQVYRMLAGELTPSRFLNFLLREERTILSDLGSERFGELSASRYRFTDDGEFDIVDLTAAEQTRKADSLSGGETFLASLALALALAEMVTRGGGRLDAFFLDEGFGSLDPEHLDLALAGIERLVIDHEERLVVLVSHVPEMHERLEELIVLDKDPATGATVVVRTPGAA